MKKATGAARFCASSWGLVCGLILCLLFFAAGESFAAKKEFLSAFLLAPAGLLFLWLLYLFVRERSIPGALGLLFLAFQILLVRSYAFKTGWDSGQVTELALKAARGDPAAASVYLSVYPNNLLLVYGFSKVFAFCFSRGLDERQAVLMILYGQCVLSGLTGLLCFRLTERVTGRSAAACWCYLVYLLLVGLSPWVSIPYSDSAALPFPVLLLWLYAERPARPALRAARGIGLGFFGWIGYSLKPTALIPLIAVALVELVRLTRGREGKALCKKALLLALGLLCARGVTAFAARDLGCELNPERRLGFAHFLAMGLNEETMGFYSEEDVAYSVSVVGEKERRDADLRLTEERAKSMGVAGLLRQWERKLLTSFHDGTFAWAEEGGFFKEIYEGKGRLSEIARSFYYPEGARYRLFLNTEQALWLGVLLLCLAAAFAPPERELCAMLLSLEGLTAYLLLFEVRARYVYIFAPVFLAVAACGMSEAERRLRMKKAGPGSR